MFENTSRSYQSEDVKPKTRVQILDILRGDLLSGSLNSTSRCIINGLNWQLQNLNYDCQICVTMK